jgi:hypothetical protein
VAWFPTGTPTCTLARSRLRSCFTPPPELVRDGYAEADHDGGFRRFLLVQGMSACTETGVIGAPSHATAEKGKTVLESLTKDFAMHLSVLGEAVEPAARGA